MFIFKIYFIDCSELELARCNMSSIFENLSVKSDKITKMSIIQFL